MQRTVSIFAVLFTITLAIQATAQPSSESQMAQEKQKPTLAVTTFEHLSAYPENVWVAMSFSEALTVKLKRLYERFRVVERVRVYEVIREQGIDPENVGVLEPTTQKDIGNLIGANYLIFGSVSLQGLAEEPTTKLLASMRTVDVQTGEIKETASISGMMQEIFDLEIQLALAFLKQVGVDPTAVEEQLLSIKETESLLAEKYYNLGNKAYYDADYPAAEAWYQKAVAITEGGYHREAALRWVDVLKRQQAAAQAVKDETVLEAIREKAGQRIKTIEQRQAEANEMNFEKAELFMIRGEYEAAIEAYQLYLAKAKRLLKWKTDIDMKGFLNVAIVVNDSLLLFNHRHLMMLDTETGKIQWKFNSLDSFSEEQLGYVYSEPVVTDGVVYWRSGGVLYALAKEAGEIRWEFAEGPKAPSYWIGVQEWRWCHWDAPPVVAEGLVYIRLSTGVLVALDKDTGEQKWEFDTESLGYSVRTNRIPAWGLSIPVVRKGILYTQYGRGIAALKADTGETVWYRELPSAPGWLSITFDEPNQANQESESWTVKLKRLFIPPEEGVVVRGFASTFLGGANFVEESDLASGDRIVETAGVPIKTQADLVRVTSAVKPNDQISIKVMRGAGKFETALSVPYRVVILSSMQGNLLYAFVNDTLSALDADTGEIQWSFSDPAGIQFALISDGTLYCAVNSIQEGWFQGGDRAQSWMQEEQLYALDSQTGKIRWQQPHKTTLEDFSLWQSAGLSPFHPDSGEPQPLPLNHYPFAVMGDQIVSETYGMDGKRQVVFTDVKTGQRVWEFSLPTYGKLLVDNETIYLVGGGADALEAVYAFDTMPESVTPLFENTPALLGLGRAYRLSGKYQKAIQPLQKAAEWHVDDLGTYRELALVYEDMERCSLAASYWDKYLSVIPPGGEAPQEIKDHLWEFAGLRWWNKDYYINHILVHNGVAYFGLGHLAKYMSAAIVGLSLQTGASQWSVGTGSGWPFVLGDGRLFVSDGGSMSPTEGVKSHIKAISLKSSETQWQTTIQYRRNVRTFPSLKFQFDRGILYVQSHTYDESTFHWVSVLHALDGETGKALWHYQQEGQGKYAKFIKFLGHLDELPHLVIGEFIYWKARRGRLYALHPKTGELVWKFERGVEGVDWEAAQRYLLWPVLLGETLFTDLGDTFYAFNAKTGSIRWQFPGHLVSQMAANQDVVVLQTNDHLRVWNSSSGIISTWGPESPMLYALDSQTGEILWRYPDWSQRIALRNDILYLFGSENLKALSADTGQAQWIREHRLSSDIEDLVIQNQTAFLLTKDYGEGYQEPVLYAIDLINGTNLWRLNLVSRWSSGNQIADADEDTLILFINRAAIYAIDLAQARRSKLALAAQESDANQLEFLSGLRDEIINWRDEIQALLSEAHQPRFAQMIEILTSYDGDAQGSFGNYLTGKQFKGLRTDIVPMLIALWKVERSTPSSEPAPSVEGTTATPSDDERNRVIQRALLALGDASIVPDLEEIVTYNGYAGPVLAKLQGDAAIPKLLDALQGHAVYYAEGIMQALATLKAKEAVPILSQRLVDAETMQEKLIIAVYLREIGDASAIPALQKAFAQAWEQLGGEGTVSACYAISSALCAVGDKKGVDGLIQLLERVDSISDGSSRISDILTDLTQYTGHDFARSEDKPEAHLREIAQRYRAWWEANKEKLIWSEEQKRFVSK